MNVYDSARMADVLAPLGYRQVSSPAGADLVILNTCHIREKAAEKVYSDIGRLKPYQARQAEAGRHMVVAIAGCVAQAEGLEIKRRAPIVDIVVGPQSYHRLPDLLARLEAEQNADLSKAGRKKLRQDLIETDFPADDKFGHLPEEQSSQGPTAFLTVQEGCDKFCTFCVVPYTRGSEFSRPVAQIIDEAKRLIDLGAREIMLLGQNVNAYHGADAGGGTCSLADLIRLLAQLDGLDRIRYTTSHPRDMTDDLIAVYGEEPACMPYLHLPLQSGSNRILKAMNRGHDTDFYLRLVEKLRATRPDIALSSDFIVGFPGETDADFEETMRLAEDVGYAQAYSFIYSARPGTPAAGLDHQLPRSVSSERIARLQAVLNRTQLAFNQDMTGKSIPVLFDREGRHRGQLIGRSPWLQAVHVDVPAGALADYFGTIRQVEILEGMANSLSGKLTSGNTARHVA